ncbi:YciI-like protein [Croceiramulus getboli]|nr:YciI-like protein [Flavobacteriaceae bacterium YJPT1-3]
MPYYLLTYELAPNYLEDRGQYRAEHLGLAKDYRDQGLLVLGGALANPADKAVLVFQCEGREQVEAFAKSDPYVNNGLVISWTVQEWTVVIGSAFS